MPMAAPEQEIPPSQEGEGRQGASMTEGKKSSWVNIVKKNKSFLTNHVVEVSGMVNGSAVAEIPDEVQNSVPLWKDFLEGRFMSDAHHVAKIHVIVNKIWPLGDKSISD